MRHTTSLFILFLLSAFTLSAQTRVNLQTQSQGPASSQVNPACAASTTFTMGPNFQTDFFVNLNCNITTSTLAGTLVQGMEAVFSITQTGAGSNTFAWPTGFLNTPTVAVGSGATTVATFQYCGATGTGSSCPANSWQNTDVGPASSVVSSASSVVDAATFGTTNYRVRVADATWSTANANVSCPNNDCNFLSSDTGLKCFGVAIGGAYAFGNSVQTFTQTGAQTGTCGSVAATSNATANGTFFLAADSTSAILAAVNALYALPRCGTLVFPMGEYLFLQSFPPPPAACSPSGYNAALGLKFKGQGRQATYLIPGPGFNFTNGANSKVIDTGNGGALEGITIDGLGASLSGVSTAPASTLINIGGVTTQGGDVFLVNWANSASNSPQGLSLQGQSFSFPNFNVSNFGKGVTCGTNVILLGMYSSSSASGGLSTGANGAACYDVGGAYCTSTPNVDCIGVPTGGFFQGWGTYTQDNGSSNEDSAAITGTFICDYCQFPGTAPSQATKVGFKIFTGSKIYLRGTDVSGGSTGGSLVSQSAGAGTIFNLGANTSHGGPFLFSGTYNDLTGTFPTVGCTGTVTASQTLGLYGTGPNVTATTCTSTTIGSGVVMKAAGTIFELLATSTAAGVNASSGAVTVLKNGVAQSMTCTIGTGTACQDGATAHQVTVAKGDLISIQFTTQAADTLAGVQASLIIW